MVANTTVPFKHFTSSSDFPFTTELSAGVSKGDECFGKYSELNILRSLHTTKILQYFEDTFSSDDHFVPSVSFVGFLQSHVSKDLSEVVTNHLENLSPSIKSTPQLTLDSLDPYSTFLPILFASPVTSVTSSPQLASLPSLHRIVKQDARKFLTEFLMKSSIRMIPKSNTPQFYLDNSCKGPLDLLSNPMPLEKRLDLIESLVKDAQETIHALQESFQNDEIERLGSPMFHSSSQ